MDYCKKRLKIIGVVLLLALLGAGTWFGARWMLALRDPQNLADFQRLIFSLGTGGWLLLLAIQYIQIVVAFIPGGPIQLIAGALFGPLGGLATCILGMLLATATVFALVQRFGHRIVRLFLKEKEIHDYKFIHDSKRLESLVFILFLIPGAPKDVLTYLFALTPIKLSRFMLLSTVARIPAVLTSVLAGDSVVNGEWLQAVICFVILTVISIAGLFAQSKVKALYRRKKT